MDLEKAPKHRRYARALNSVSSIENAFVFFPTSQFQSPPSDSKGMATKTVEFVADILGLDGDHSDWLAIGILSYLEVFAGDLRPTVTRDDLRTIQAWLDNAMDTYDKFRNGLLKAAALLTHVE